MTKQTNQTQKPARAARKNAKPAENKIETVQTVEQPTQKSLYARIVDAINTRMQSEICTDNMQKELTRVMKTLNDRICEEAQKRLPQTDFDRMVRMFGEPDKLKKEEFFSSKSAEKIASMLRAIAQGIMPTNNYLYIGIITMLENNNCANVSEIICAMSKKARENADYMKIREEIKTLSTYTIGTANSQTGQVRDTLRVLGVANVKKGGRGDNAILNDYGIEVFAGLVKRAGKGA